MMTPLNSNIQSQFNHTTKSSIKLDLAIGLGLCLCILPALSGLYLWKTNIYNNQFNELIKQQKPLFLCSRIFLELEQQCRFLLSLVYQDNPKSKENFEQSRKRAHHMIQEVKTAGTYFS